MVNEQYSVEVVDLVTYGLREQSLCLDLAPPAALVLSPDAKCGRPFDGGEETWERQAALL
jgi:hypothetical protein